MASHQASRARTVASVLILVTAALTAVAAVRYVRASGSSRFRGSPETLVASLRAAPRSFNRYVARDLSTTVLTYLLHGSLVRINHVTNELEPELAERWELLPDRRTYRLRLRTGLRFSDGAPFSADDVVFSFRAIYDRATDSVLADTLQVAGQPLGVTAEDATTVAIRFPAEFGPGLRMLDGVPIYPRHRLEAALKTGTFRSAWSLSTPASDLAGLGPFMLRSYEPGQRLTLDRNPYFRRSDGEPAKIAHVVLDVVPDQDAELLALESGAIDVTQSELRPFDVPALKRAAGSGRVIVSDAGVGLDGDLLWFNLTPAKGHDPRSRWLQHRDFRRALAHAVDRTAFVDTVYLGEGVPADSIISPGNRAWHAVAPPPEYNIVSANRLLASLGLLDRTRDGTLEDDRGNTVTFTLLTQKGNTSLERGAAAVRDSLARVGVHVDVVALEVGAVIEHIMRGDYDAAYFRLLATDTDPALNLDFWLTSGSAHMWNPGQDAPATPWEAEIDALMNQMSTMLEHDRRRQRFADVQRIMARELPVVCFAFPRLPIAVSARVVDATPAPFRPPVLWNPAVISLKPKEESEVK
jgi:peptide/nickel transport system substrate-binding protein